MRRSEIGCTMTAAALAVGVMMSLPAAGATAGSASACAPTRPSGEMATSARSSRRELVPGRPIAVRLCDYGPADAQPTLPLIGSGASRRASELRRLTRLANRLSAVPNRMNCPSDDGSLTVLTFTYPHGVHRTVIAGRSGCRIARRGSIARLGLGGHGDAWVAAVQRLLAAVP